MGLWISEAAEHLSFFKRVKFLAVASRKSSHQISGYFSFSDTEFLFFFLVTMKGLPLNYCIKLHLQ